MLYHQHTFCEGSIDTILDNFSSASIIYIGSFKDHQVIQNCIPCPFTVMDIKQAVQEIQAKAS